MYSFIIFSLIGFVVSVTVAEYAGIEDEGWKMWKADHNKTYSDFGEDEMRFAIWKDNFRRIIEYNANSSNLFLAMNHFGDMTNLEFRATMNGYSRGSVKRNGSTFLPPSNLVLPHTVDWRKEGMVTPVKNQGQCGSCWSFSATGSLEGQYQRKTKKLVSLSEQNLIDCSSGRFGNRGCNGGTMVNAFAYIRHNGGINSEASYRYTAVKGLCRFNKQYIAATVMGHINIESGNEYFLKNAVGTVGPISVGVDASLETFQFYHTGVYFDRRCSSTTLNHAVLIAGYGTSMEGDYWLVKNSWSAGWGENGYIRMSRNTGNNCGIATDASYPLV